MKYILAIILAVVVFLLSYIIFTPYLLMSFRFVDHFNATAKACGNLLDWVDNNYLS